MKVEAHVTPAAIGDEEAADVAGPAGAVNGPFRRTRASRRGHDGDRPSLWRVGAQLAAHEPRSFWSGWAFFILFFTAPAFVGYSFGRGFAALGDGDTASVVRWGLAMAAFEFLRLAAVTFGALQWTKAWVHVQTLLRGNMLAAQMASGGPEAGQPVGSAGEAITHFRDDAQDVAMLLDVFVDTCGGLVFMAFAGFFIGRADPAVAVIIFVPLLIVVIASQILDGRIKRYREADRAAAGRVTSHIGDVMAAATTVKVNNATDSVVDHLADLSQRRLRTAVRDRTLDEGIFAVSNGIVEVAFGVVLVVSAGALADGSFDPATLAMLVAYMGWLGFVPRIIGRFLARGKQATVALRRMGALVAGRDVSNVVQQRELPIEAWMKPRRPAPARPARRRLEVLEVDRLTATYPAGGGVHDVSFTVRRGDFVVVTGPVASGKSTLLRAILGLAWQAEVSGEVRWNGEVLADRAAFLVPPNAAYLAQVPQLLSDTVRDNIGLGPIDDEALAAALSLAVIDQDIAHLPDGEHTMIGPRGLRLSGGQRQRLAAARALVHRPELVVVDDLSSAVDVETELALWDRLAAAGQTVIAVSHRAVAFERATTIVHLDAGRVVDGGAALTVG